MSRPTTRHSDRPASAAAIARGITARAAAAVVAALLVVPLSGCDGEDPARTELDRALRAGWEDASGIEAARRAVAHPAGPPSVRAIGNQLVGDLATTSAMILVAGPLWDDEAETPTMMPGLMALDTAALTLGEQMNQLAGVVVLGRIYVDSDRARNPQPLLREIEQKVEQVSGDQWSADAATLPGLARTRQQVDQLRQQAQQLEQELEQLESRRRQLLSEANRLEEDAERQRGEQGGRLFRQVADLRNQAATVIAEADHVFARALVTRGQLQEAEALLSSLEEAVGVLQGQANVLRQSWQEIEGRIGDVERASRQTLEGEMPSVAGLAEELADVMTRAGELRGEALEILSQAGEAFEASESQMQQARQPWRGGAMEELDQMLRAAYDVNRPRLGRAVASSREGSIHVSHAISVAPLVRLDRTLRAGGLSMPGGLPENPAGEFAAAVDEAHAALENADRIFTELTGAADGTLRQSALAHHVSVHISWRSLRQLVDQTGVEVTAEIPSVEAIERQLSQIVAEARRERVTLPPLPGIAPPEPEPEAPVDPDEPPADPDEPMDPDDPMDPDEPMDDPADPDDPDDPEPMDPNDDPDMA